MRPLALLLALLLVACAPSAKPETVEPAQPSDFSLEFYPGAQVLQMARTPSVAVAKLQTGDSPDQVRQYYAQRLPGGAQTMEWTSDNTTWWLLFPKETPSPTSPTTRVAVGTGPKTVIELRTQLPANL